MRASWILVVPVFAILGCGKSSSVPEGETKSEVAKPQESQIALSSDSQKLVGIETSLVRYEQVQESLQVPGTVESTSNGRAVVTPPVAGRIVSIAIQLGDKVQKGQSLATMESPELAQAWSNIAEATRLRDISNADLKQARAEVQLSSTKLRTAQQSLARQRELAKAGAFSQAPLQHAQTEMNDAQSELLSIQKDQASHDEQLRRLESLLRDGIVSRADVNAARLLADQDHIKLERAKASLESARASYGREKTIFGRDLLSAKEIQTAEADVRLAELELNRARLRVISSESALRTAKQSISNAQAVYQSNQGNGSGSVGRVNLTAPIDGTVTRVDVTRGQAVDRTQAVFEVENLQSVWVSASVPEQDSSKVRVGAPAHITLASLVGKEFEGIVQVVGSKVDPKTRSVPALCLVSGAAGLLKPDMFATVRLGVSARNRSLVVPKSAVVADGKKSFVLVQTKEGFEKRAIELGAEAGDHIAVRTGLHEGERVASEGTFVLASELRKDELKGEE